VLDEDVTARRYQTGHGPEPYVGAAVRARPFHRADSPGRSPGRSVAADVAAVGDQVLRALLGVSDRAHPPGGVLVAGELTPGEAAELDSSRVAAVVQAFGS